MNAPRIELLALPGLPEVQVGDNLGELIVSAMDAAQLAFQAGDVLTIAQKIVSKAEGRTRRIWDIIPSEQALFIAEQCQQDPRKVQAILDESDAENAVVRIAPGVLIVRHRHGWVCANAGIDESNLGADKQGELLLLPLDTDASARAIASHIEQASAIRPGVVITDSFGRPWRRGLLNVAIGTAELSGIVDWIGEQDAYGRTLVVTQQALADEIAAASGLLSLKNASLPVCLLRGLDWQAQPEASAQSLVRPLKEDLFR